MQTNLHACSLRANGKRRIPLAAHGRLRTTCLREPVNHFTSSLIDLGNGMTMACPGPFLDQSMPTTFPWSGEPALLQTTGAPCHAAWQPASAPIC